MGITYYKLFILLKKRGLKSKDLIEDGIVSPATMAKLSKNSTVNTSTLAKLCCYLKVQPGDIMEYEDDI